MNTADPANAQKRVEAKLGFYNHLAVYVIVMAALLAINLMTSRHTLWFLWPLVGWGVAILFHFFGVFVFGKDTRLYQRMLDHEMHQRS
jgi:hypothetical protein